MPDHALLVHEKQALLEGRRRVMVETAQEIAISQVGDGAPELSRCVAGCEGVGEAHEDRARRLQDPPISQAVHGVETLVGIAHEWVGQADGLEKAACPFEEVGCHLDHLGLGGDDPLVAVDDGIHVSATERTGEATREPDDDMLTAVIGAEIDGSPWTAGRTNTGAGCPTAARTSSTLMAPNSDTHEYFHASPGPDPGPKSP